MTKKNIFCRTLSLLLIVVMLFGMTTTVYAGEDPSGTTYGIEVLQGERGTVTVDKTSAEAGEIVTVEAVAAEGYVLTQVAYRVVKDNVETEDPDDKLYGKTVEVALENGKYSFKMPEADIQVAAAFQKEGGPILYGSGTGGTSLGVIGSKETNYNVYVASWDAFLHESATKTDVYLAFDKRFLGIDGVTMTLESRQYNNEGYKTVGKVTYTKEQIEQLAETATADESNYILKSISIPVTGENSYEAGMSQYCVVQFGYEEWKDAFGKPLYRWNYTGVDANIVEDSAKIPEAIVWLYNLDENSYRGSVVRKVLDELQVEAGTINNDNLGQNIGYLVNWEGYESVENPYHSGHYDLEYMLMGNLADAELDLLLSAMDENNIFVELKSIPTAWTAGKTFVELFEIMAEESEVLQEAVALDKMIYAAEQLDEETYGQHEAWNELQAEIVKALDALQTDAEETGLGAALYRDARLALENVYLKVTGKVHLDGELVLNLEDLKDGTYKVTASIDSDIENQTYTYNWEPAASSEEAAADYLVVKKADLYKVSLEVTASGNYYGTMSATLNVPKAPEYSVTTGPDRISVTVGEANAAVNTPAANSYVVELYLNGEKIQSQESASAKTFDFNNLDADTEYTVKVNASNIVGRSDIKEFSVKTAQRYEYTGNAGNTGSAGGNTAGDAGSADDENTSDADVLMQQIDKIKLSARTKLTTKNGKKAVMISWAAKNGADLSDVEGYQVFRSTKKNSGYGKKAIFTTKNTTYLNTAVQNGRTYYYKVRGYVTIEGQRYYTGWSTKAYRTVK